MPNRKPSPDRVNVEFVEIRSTTWSRPGGKAVRGKESIYRVTDENRQSFKQWEFAVRVPSRSGDIQVIPTKHPAIQAIAELLQRAVMFMAATRRRFEGYSYCKVNLSDPSGEKNRVGVRYEDRDELPEWFKEFPRSIFYRKELVAATEGTDGNALVCVARPANHERMIRLYFAMRVWVLLENARG